MVTALVFSLIGVAGAGTLVEVLVTAVIMTALVTLVFAVGSTLPEIFGQGLLAVATGLVGGSIAGSILCARPRFDAAEEPAESKSLETAAPAPASASSAVIAVYDGVEFVRLTLKDREWTEGADAIARFPRMGDRGVVVAIDEDTRGLVYTVEVFDSDSNTICVAEALGEELVVI
jgi:hypothetical protein